MTEARGQMPEHIKAPGNLPRWRSLLNLEGVSNFDRSLFTVSQSIVEGVTAFLSMSLKAGNVENNCRVARFYLSSGCHASHHTRKAVSRFVQMETKISCSSSCE